MKNDPVDLRRRSSSVLLGAVLLWLLRAFRLVLVAMLGLADYVAARGSRKFTLLYSVYNAKVDRMPKHVAFALPDEVDGCKMPLLLATCCHLGIGQITLYRPGPWPQPLKRLLLEDCYARLPKGTPLPSICFLSSVNAMPSVLDTVRAVAAQSSGQRDRLFVALERRADFKPVDLLVLFGHHNSTLGYPAFNLSWAEIHTLPDTSDASCANFLRTVDVFAHTERRYGV